MTRTQKLVLIISVLASFVAFLDSSVVNVALPAITKDLGGGLAAQQWVVDAYLITLGALILLAGSLSDLFGRKRILTAGLIGFGVSSLLCALSPGIIFLIAGRALQGTSGALLVPSSLALIISCFKGMEQSKAIGRWTAYTGISFVIGPLLGGFLVDVLSWRYIFVINVLPIAVCLYLLRLFDYPEQSKNIKVDVTGAVLCSVGFSLAVFGLIEEPRYGWSDPIIFIPFVAGLALLVGFILYEKRASHAMLPLGLFKVRNFRVGNITTAAFYGGLSIATFLIVIFLQQVVGYSAFLAGLALLPITITSFFLSPRFGALAGRFGPRLFMAAGPLVAGFGFLLMLRVHADLHYWTELFPGVMSFAIGLSMTVAPLTSAVLKDVNPANSGIASAVNNAISRVAGLITIAVIGVVVGSHLDVAGFHRAIIVTAILLFIGGIVSAIGITNVPEHESTNV